MLAFLEVLMLFLAGGFLSMSGVLSLSFLMAFLFFVILGKGFSFSFVMVLLLVLVLVGGLFTLLTLSLALVKGSKSGGPLVVFLSFFALFSVFGVSFYSSMGLGTYSSVVSFFMGIWLVGTLSLLLVFYNSGKPKGALRAP